jgi:hypothetical protein
VEACFITAYLVKKRAKAHTMALASRNHVMIWINGVL